MRRLAILPLLALITLLAACGDDDETTASGADGGGGDGTGTLVIRFEETEGILVEGFEAAFRVETPDGEVLDSVLWGDHVASLGADDPEAYYTSTYEVDVPAGQVVVRGEVNVGIGPAPEVPDVDGDLRCELTVDVPAGERVEVEATFSGESDCLRPAGGA